VQQTNSQNAIPVLQQNVNAHAINTHGEEKKRKKKRFNATTFMIHGLLNDEYDSCCVNNIGQKPRDYLPATHLFQSSHKMQNAINYESHIKHLSMENAKMFFSLVFQNFATADRPRCMRDENFLRQNRRNRRFEYGSDEYEQTNWYWNMNHQPNGNVPVNTKKSHQKPSKNAVFPSSRSTQSSSSSGFQSFFRWFRKDEKSRAVSDIRYPREICSSTDTLEFENDRRYVRRKLKAYDSNDTISPPSSPRLSQAFSQSSSCDSVFSTASSFAFVPPLRYLSNRNQKQVSYEQARNKA
jgi:hypothetical protein